MNEDSLRQRPDLENLNIPLFPRHQFVRQTVLNVKQHLQYRFWHHFCAFVIHPPVFWRLVCRS